VKQHLKLDGQTQHSTPNNYSNGECQCGINSTTTHSAFISGPRSGNFEKHWDFDAVSFLEKENFSDCELL
jgi:hypothetical protein